MLLLSVENNANGGGRNQTIFPISSPPQACIPKVRPLIRTRDSRPQSVE